MEYTADNIDGITFRTSGDIDSEILVVSDVNVKTGVCTITETNPLNKNFGQKQRKYHIDAITDSLNDPDDSWHVIIPAINNHYEIY